MPYLETVQELLEAKEGEHVQFKEAKNRFDFGEAAKCCCALANNGGGKLVFDITDKRPRSVVGSAAFDQPERTRMGLIEKLKVNVDFQLFNYERKRVLVFDVKSRPIGLPVQYEGVAWIYEGDTLKPMPEDMRRSIYEETGGDFSGTICAGATVDDLDETAIENFRAKWEYLAYGVGFVAVSVPVGFLLAYIFAKNGYARKIYNYSFAVANFSFMGNAVVLGVFGEEVLFDYMMFTLPLTLYVYSYGTAAAIKTNSTNIWFKTAPKTCTLTTPDSKY